MSGARMIPATGVLTLVIDSRAVAPQVAWLATRLRETKGWHLEVALSGREPRARAKLLAAIQRLEAGLISISGRPAVQYAIVELDATSGLSAGQGIYINASESLDDAELSALVNAPVLSSTATRGGHLLGFSEVFHAERGSCFDVSLTLPGNATRRVTSGRLQTQLFYLENLQSLAAHADHYLLEFLRTGTYEEVETAPAPASPHTMRSLAAYPARLMRRFAAKAVSRLPGRRLTWNVAARSGNGKAPPSILRNPPGCFCADPFVIRRGGEDYCFVEELSFANPKGVIVCYRIRAGQFERIGVALEESFHLSFPFLFEEDGVLFMCPESSANRDVRIYRCTSFPLEWSLHGIALARISAVDTIVVRRDARWWMITCVNPLGTGTQFSEMRIFCGNTVDGPWIPHTLNPLRIDEVEARNGGFFEDAGKAYRVNQVQGFAVYGESIGINEILHVDNGAYRERPVPSTPPIAGANVVGVHHLSRSGDLTVFDFSTSRG